MTVGLYKRMYIKKQGKVHELLFGLDETIQVLPRSRLHYRLISSLLSMAQKIAIGKRVAARMNPLSLLEIDSLIADTVDPAFSQDEDTKKQVAQGGVIRKQMISRKDTEKK